MESLCKIRRTILLTFLFMSAVASSSTTFGFTTVGEGWDGSGQGMATVNFYFGQLTPDLNGHDVRTTLNMAMQEWENAADISFVETSTPLLDNSIDFSFLSGDHFFRSELAHGFFPAPPNLNPIAGDIHFNDSFLWEIGNGLGRTAYDLTHVAVHEIGHALGLGHSTVADAVMFSTVSPSTVYSELHADDLAGIQSIYSNTNPQELAPIPEPSTYALLSLGLICIGISHRRKMNKAAFQS